MHFPGQYGDMVSSWDFVQRFQLVGLQDQGRPLPKFGEWDVNDPASAEGFTVIFNKARDERKTGGSTPGPESLGKDDVYNKEAYPNKPSNTKKWFCCMQASPAES